VPPGASVRKAGTTSTSSSNDPAANEYVSVILDITVDDICIGDTPLSLTTNPEVKVSDVTLMKLDMIKDECNSIVKDVCRDLLSVGYSVYDVVIDKKNKMFLIPYIDPVEFYLTKDKKVVCYSVNDDSSRGQNLASKLIFINYTKRDLIKVEDAKSLPSRALFKITPRPMQLQNVGKAVSQLAQAEDSIAKYRALLRPMRWANVDIGTAQGDQQNDVIDSISSAINANSTSLASSESFQEYDDNLPVLPNRKGLGKVEVASDIPNANISELADLDYNKQKIAMLMRFPASYMDFSKSLGETAVSMLRGDLRYSKLCKAVSSKIIATLNEFIQTSKFAEYEPVFSLTQLPSSEDDDVIEALSNYTDLCSSVEEYLNGQDYDPRMKLHRLEVLRALFAVSTTSPYITEWFGEYRSFYEEELKAAQAEESEGAGGPGGPDGDFGGPVGDFGDGDFGGGGDFDFGEEPGGGDDFGAEPGGGADDVEMMQPQSEG